MRTLTLSVMLLASAALTRPALAAVGSCTGMADGTPCASGDACTTDDRCQHEDCAAGPDICSDGGVPMPLVQAPTPVIPSWCMPVTSDGGINPMSRVAGGGGCTMAGRGETSGVGILIVLALALGVLLRRRRVGLALALALTGCATTAAADRPRAQRAEACQRLCDRVLDTLATSMFDGERTCRCFAPKERWDHHHHPSAAEITFLTPPERLQAQR